MISNLPTRFSWQDDFPKVVVHSDVQSRDAHPDYALAKAGDPVAAIRLAKALLTEIGCAEIGRILQQNEVLILPVVADEEAGFNAIPDAMAHVIGGRLGFSVVSASVLQSNKVGHTRAKSFQRIVTPAQFKGEIAEGRRYFLVDDHVGVGGTLANLKGFVEGQGGLVVGMSTLSMNEGGDQISLTDETRDELWRRHGQSLDTLWQAQFGHGIDCLTEREARLLCRQSSVDIIEARLAQAAIEARSRNLGL